jgi:hypothetical protein
MVIADSDLGRAKFIPNEDDAPLVIDADGVAAGQITF